jgi:prepilin-type N-terminal cleavage/methylation domain-containing protein
MRSIKNAFTQRGFTLTELMIVIVIVGVLVTLAINQLYGPREQAFQREAEANLKLIAAAEKIYRMEIGGYMDGTDATALNSDLSLMLPASNPQWAYKVVGSSANAFTAKAGRLPGNSPVYCINQSTDDPYTSGCSW